MKKIFIGVVVLLAAALIGLKYLTSKKQAGAPSVMPGLQAEQQGVALPAGATGYVTADSAAPYSPAQEGSGNYETLSLPAAALGLKGACEGGSPKEIMENLGKTWGYSTGRRNAFEPKHTQEMYNFVWEYYSCLASAHQDITICNDLPGEPPKEALKFGSLRRAKPPAVVAVDIPPAEQCREKNLVFLFKAYVAGKTKDQQNCMSFIGEGSSEDLGKFSPGEFCEVAAQGPEKVLAYFKKKVPEDSLDVELKMAFSRSVCGSDAECLTKYAIWEGIKTGNPDRCPADYKLNCAALEKKSPAPCSAILDQMSGKYCGYYKNLLKAGSGYVGVTPEEVKEKLRLEAVKKAEAELLRKEQEAAIKQINEKARKIIGKKGEGE